MRGIWILGKKIPGSEAKPVNTQMQLWLILQKPHEVTATAKPQSLFITKQTNEMEDDADRHYTHLQNIQNEWNAYFYAKAHTCPFQRANSAVSLVPLSNDARIMGL